MANRFAPPARSFFDNSMAKSRLIARESVQQNIAGAQTISVPNVTVATSGGAAYAVATLGSTTATSTTTNVNAITVASTTGISAGSVLLLGGSSAGEVVWVDSVAGSTVNLTTTTVLTHSNGSNVSILAALQSECYEAQDPTGVDLGVGVVSTMTSQVQFPATSCSAFQFVVAIRTGFPYGAIQNVRANTVSYGTYSDIVGPQQQAISWTSNGSNGAYYAAASGTAVISLEWPTIVLDYTLTSLCGAGSTSSILSGTPGTGVAAELMIGDDADPPELCFGTFGGAGGLTFSNTLPLGTQLTHASGASAVNPTSGGQSSWTFIPYYAVNAAGSASLTFAANTLTIDPR